MQLQQISACTVGIRLNPTFLWKCLLSTFRRASNGASKWGSGFSRVKDVMLGAFLAAADATTTRIITNMAKDLLVKKASATTTRRGAAFAIHVLKPFKTWTYPSPSIPTTTSSKPLAFPFTRDARRCFFPSPTVPTTNDILNFAGFPISCWSRSMWKLGPEFGTTTLIFYGCSKLCVESFRGGY